MSSSTRPAHILPVIIFSQFTGTSLWFAGNAIILDLQRDWGLAEQSLGYVTSAVQLGFICGTLLFALLVIADRFSPRWVFFNCSLAAALANIALLITPQELTWLLVLRFATGFFLAGIYPVGMKIAAGWYEQGLGRALGYLVGALVLGTAFPHLVRSSGTDLPWEQVMLVVSVLAILGGFVMLMLVPDGPHLPRGSAFDPNALKIIFRSRRFRASAFGYFGHMWELYTLWAFIPLLLLAYATSHEFQPERATLVIPGNRGRFFWLCNRWHSFHQAWQRPGGGISTRDFGSLLPAVTSFLQLESTHLSRLPGAMGNHRDR